MNNVGILLKARGIKATQLKANVLFDACPFCGASETATINETKFGCTACTTTPVSNQEVFEHLKIKVDDSPTGIKGLIEKHVMEIVDPDNAVGVSTGFTNLDERTGGLMRGHLYILGAETGMGKSVFSTNLLVNVITKSNQKCSYFDLENGRFASITRYVAIKSRISVAELKTPENITAFIEAGEAADKMLQYWDHVKLDAFISHLSGVRMGNVICDLIRADVEAHKTRVVVIDPLENFENDDKGFVEMGKVVENFKNLAQELMISIIILHHIKKPSSQMSKTVSDIDEVIPQTYRIPTIHDFIGSSKITNKATDVWVIVRKKDDPDLTKQGKILLRVLKGREAPANVSGDLFYMMNLENLCIFEVRFEPPVIQEERRYTYGNS